MTRIDTASPYRVQGKVTSIAEFAKDKPGMITASTAAEVAEMKLHEQQTEARRAASDRYARENPSKIYAQVFVKGEVFATIYDSGHTGTKYAIPLTENGEGLDLAKTRLAEVMKAVKGGEVRFSNFEVPPGPPPAVVPESALPKVTARSLSEMIGDLDWQLARSRMPLEDSSKT